MKSGLVYLVPRVKDYPINNLTVLQQSSISPISSPSITKKNDTRSWVNDLLILLLSIALIYGIFLGHRPLSVPDEARYAEIPREIIATGNYITPHLNYIKYFEKPVFFYWLQAGAMKLWGINEWAVRIPNAIMALLGCLVTYAIGRTLYDRRTGILASLILASSALYFVLAHLVTLDMTLSVLITASLMFFILGSRTTPSRLQRLYYYGFYSFIALAVLTKGLVGLILPSIIIGSWLLFFNQWHLIKNFYIYTGTLIFLAIAAPWHILVQLHNPEFFQFYFLEQQFLRYFTLTAHRYQPNWFFIAVVLGGFLPWAIFLIQALYYHLHSSWRDRKQNKYTYFLLLWIVIIFTFFSLSQSKLIPYILPIFPPLAILTARYLSLHWNERQSALGIKVGYAIFPVLLLLIAMAVPLVNYIHTIPTLHALKPILFVLGAIWGTGALLALHFIRKQLPAFAFSVLLVSTLLAQFLVVAAIPTADNRSIQPLAMKLAPILKPEDEVIAYGAYYQDLPFYLQRRVTVVNAEGELDFGMQHQDTHSWMIQDKDFPPLWQSAKKIYVITDTDTYGELMQAKYKIYLLAKTANNVLLANHLN